MAYLERVVDGELEHALQRQGAVIVEGPKACGKTESSDRQAASSVRLDTDRAAAALLDVDPALLLEGATPRLFDEWQTHPQIWDLVRHEVDDRKRPGQFILTGSTRPQSDAMRHSGAGRFARVRMRTMTLAETGHSTAAVSLAALMRGEAPRAPDPGLDYRSLVERIVIGGWPGSLDLQATDAAANVRDYVAAVADVEVPAAAGSRDPSRVRRLLRALSRSIATEVTVTTLARDADLSRDSVRDYCDALDRIHVLEDQPAWSTHLRSSATLRKEPKRHLADPSLAVAALGADAEAVIADPGFAGQLFESLVVHELRVFAQPLAGSVMHARDSVGREVDAIVQTPDGAWAAFEVKLGSSPAVIDAAASSLLSFASNVAGTREASLTVVTTSGPSYRRADGVNVVAIGALGASSA